MSFKCNKSLELDVSAYVDHYSYHDAQTIFNFSCERERGHEELHMAVVEGQEIFWVDDS